MMKQQQQMMMQMLMGFITPERIKDLEAKIVNFFKKCELPASEGGIFEEGIKNPSVLILPVNQKIKISLNSLKKRGDELIVTVKKTLNLEEFVSLIMNQK